jgi:hypothetical protein
VFWQLVREKSLVPKCVGIRQNRFDISKGIFENDICCGVISGCVRTADIPARKTQAVSAMLSTTTLPSANSRSRTERIEFGEVLPMCPVRCVTYVSGRSAPSKIEIGGHFACRPSGVSWAAFEEHAHGTIICGRIRRSAPSSLM